MLPRASGGFGVSLMPRARRGVQYVRRRAGGPIRSMIRRLVRPLPRNLVLKKLPTESHGRAKIELGATLPNLTRLC